MPSTKRKSPDPPQGFDGVFAGADGASTNHQEQKHNTLSKPEKTKSRHLRFTWYNYEQYLPSMEQLQVNQFFSEIAEQWVVQEERCPTTGRLHLQGYLRTKYESTGRRLSFTHLIKANIQALIPTPDQPKPWLAMSNYCQKDDTWTGRYRYNSIDYIPDEDQKPVILKHKQLWDDYDTINEKPWQAFVRELLMVSKPHKRHIYWFFSNNGEVGKSTLTRHLIINDPTKVFYTDGSRKHIFHAYRDFCDTHGYPRAVIFDLARDQQAKISYTTLEKLKNGYFFVDFASKPGNCVFNWPHIIVFANWPPDVERLSKDRWRIYEIDPENRPVYGTPESIRPFLVDVEALYQGAGLAPGPAPPAAPQLQPSAAEVNSGNVGVGSAAPRAEVSPWDLYLNCQ